MDQPTNHGGGRYAAATSIPVRPKVLSYDEWLVASGAALAVVVREVYELLPPPAVTPGRKPRADAIERRKVCTATLVANLAAIILGPVAYEGLAVPLASKAGSRYDRGAFSKDVLRACVGDLREAGLLTVTDAIYKLQRTILTPTEKLRQIVSGHCAVLGDIGIVAGRETIELWTGGPKRPPKEPISYKDTAKTEKMRKEMEAINTGLSKAVIAFGGRRVHPIGSLVRKFRAVGETEPHTFTLHGRLYGGFWQTLPKTERYFLSIDGEDVADIDFSAMFMRLAYCRQRVQPPSGDLYAIPGLEGHRQTIKPLVNSLFFRQPEKAAARLPSEASAVLPESWTMPRLKAAVSALHPAIAPLFDTNVGMELFAAEADIRVAVLLELLASGVTALGMHDGILVAKSKTEFAMKTMRRVSFQKTGFSLEVSEKPIKRPA